MNLLWLTAGVLLFLAQDALRLISGKGFFQFFPKRQPLNCTSIVRLSRDERAVMPVLFCGDSSAEPYIRSPIRCSNDEWVHGRPNDMGLGLPESVPDAQKAGAFELRAGGAITWVRTELVRIHPVFSRSNSETVSELQPVAAVVSRLSPQWEKRKFERADLIPVWIHSNGFRTPISTGSSCADGRAGERAKAFKDSTDSCTRIERLRQKAPLNYYFARDAEGCLCA